MKFTLHQGNNLELLKALPDNSVDAVVTDPPYGLGKEPDALAMLRDWIETGHHEVKGRGFMGKAWDAFVPQPVQWREIFRVLKPGGHVLAFAGTRTQDLMSLGLRLAGFEIRDIVAWVYGSGFPKSLDVSKAIDRQRVEDVGPIRVICRFVRAAMDAKSLKSRDLAESFNGCHPRLIDHWAARDTDSQPTLPTLEQWARLKTVLNLSDEFDDEVLRLNSRKGEFSDTWKSAEVIGEYEGETPGFGEHRFSSHDKTIREHSDAASEWEGWGTALKPALEPITLARKPLEGTVAANVLKWHTGAVNVDGCRVGNESTRRNSNAGTNGEGWGMGKGSHINGSDSGRWPANLIHDGSEEVLTNFPGELETSAARFFYCAKASKADRDSDNIHPTVKPTALMRYLCRLITPPGGVVLDPWMGSGSTGKAASLEGFDFIGMELSQEYFDIAKTRIEAVAPVIAPPAKTPEQLAFL